MTTTLPAILGGEPAFSERLPLVRPTIEDPSAVASRVEQILDSGMLTNGATVRELEAAVCEHVGGGHAVAVASCTAGLMLTYQALGVAGSRVLLPSFTFAASAHAAVWAGAEVDFVEVTAARASADVDDIAQQIREGGPVAALSGTHVYGHPAEVESLQTLAEQHGIPIVYDAAHALGSRRDGRAIGGFGAAEVFSLSPTKVVVAGEGGVVTTGDEGLAETLRLGRDYGNPGDYDCRFAGLNARMSEVHAALALASLAEVERHVDRRNDLVDRFEAQLGDAPGLRVVRPAAGDRSTYKDLTVVIEPHDFGITAAQLQAALAADHIDSRRYYSPPIHRQRAYATEWRNPRELPATDHLSERVLSPPLWSHLTDEQLDRLCQAIARIHDHAPGVQQALPSEPR